MKWLLSLFISVLSVLSFAQINMGLVAKYSFNAGNANDEIGSNDGAVNGASLTMDRFGNPNMAYSFDGVDDFIDFGDNAAFQFGDGDFSYSLWFKMDTLQFSSLFGKQSLQSGYAVNFGTDDVLNLAAGEHLRFMESDNGAARFGVAQIQDFGWHHVAVVHDFYGSTSFYVDNQFISSDNNLFSNVNSFNVTGTNLLLGSHAIYNIFFQGDADDIRIYDRLLTVQDIDDLFNEGSSAGFVEMDDLSIELYPNPANDELNVQGVALIDAEVSVLDLNGKELNMFKAQSPTCTVDLSNYQNGVYLLLISSTEGTKTFRFVKN